MDQPLIILVVILAASLGMMTYSLILQKAATKRQAKNMLSVQESIERQMEAIKLQKESNELLRVCLKSHE